MAAGLRRRPSGRTAKRRDQDVESAEQGRSKIILSDARALRLLKFIGRLNVLLLLICIGWLGAMSAMMDEGSADVFISAHDVEFRCLWAAYLFYLASSLYLTLYSSYLFLRKKVAVKTARALFCVLIVSFLWVVFVLGCGLALW